jgi:hypothetical protein
MSDDRGRHQLLQNDSFTREEGSQFALKTINVRARGGESIGGIKKMHCSPLTSIRPGCSPMIHYLVDLTMERVGIEARRLPAAGGGQPLRTFSVVYFCPQTITAAEHVEKTITAAENDQKTITAAENDQKRSRRRPAWRPQTLMRTGFF